MEPSLPERESGAPLRVLVVDGYPDTAWTLGLVLRRMGDDVRDSCDGSTALQLATAFRPEAVVMDLALPGVDGLEVARRLRREPALDGVLLIAMTGFQDEEHRRLAREAGFDLYLLKPVPLDELQALLRAATRRDAQEAELAEAVRACSI